MALSGTSSSEAPDPAFLTLAATWTSDQADLLLGFVWAAYDRMCAGMPHIDSRDLERSITQALEPRIQEEMSGYEPFYVQHGSFERETMAAQPAQPPAYDIAFVLRAEERIMWPLEAKVLETPRKIAEYERDVREQYLTCRYAPFSAWGAMLGYLLSGSADAALSCIESKLGSRLASTPAFADRPHRISSHRRAVPAGKSYPANFRCYHLILRYSDLRRSSGNRLARRLSRRPSSP